MKKLLTTALALHLLVGTAAFLTMDADLGGGVVRRALDALIDAYEVLGFGMFPLGLAVVTVALAGPLVWLQVHGRQRG